MNNPFFLCSNNLEGSNSLLTDDTPVDDVGIIPLAKLRTTEYHGSVNDAIKSGLDILNLNVLKQLPTDRTTVVFDNPPERDRRWLICSYLSDTSSEYTSSMSKIKTEDDLNENEVVTTENAFPNNLQYKGLKNIIFNGLNDFDNIIESYKTANLFLYLSQESQCFHTRNLKTYSLELNYLSDKIDNLLDTPVNDIFKKYFEANNGKYCLSKLLFSEEPFIKYGFCVFFLSMKQYSYTKLQMYVQKLLSFYYILKITALVYNLNVDVLFGVSGSNEKVSSDVKLFEDVRATGDILRLNNIRDIRFRFRRNTNYSSGLTNSNLNGFIPIEPVFDIRNAYDHILWHNISESPSHDTPIPELGDRSVNDVQTFYVRNSYGAGLTDCWCLAYFRDDSDYNRVCTSGNATYMNLNVLTSRISIERNTRYYNECMTPKFKDKRIDSNPRDYDYKILGLLDNLTPYMYHNEKEALFDPSEDIAFSNFAYVTGSTAQDPLCLAYRFIATEPITHQSIPQREMDRYTYQYLKLMETSSVHLNNTRQHLDKESYAEDKYGYQPWWNKLPFSLSALITPKFDTPYEDTINGIISRLKDIITFKSDRSKLPSIYFNPITKTIDTSEYLSKLNEYLANNQYKFRINDIVIEYFSVRHPFEFNKNIFYKGYELTKDYSSLNEYYYKCKILVSIPETREFPDSLSSTEINKKSLPYFLNEFDFVIEFIGKLSLKIEERN